MSGGARRKAIALVDRYLEDCGGERAGFVWVVHESDLAVRIERAIAKAYRRGLREGGKRK